MYFCRSFEGHEELSNSNESNKTLRESSTWPYLVPAPAGPDPGHQSLKDTGDGGRDREMNRELVPGVYGVASKTVTCILAPDREIQLTFLARRVPWGLSATPGCKVSDRWGQLTSHYSRRRCCCIEHLTSSSVTNVSSWQSLHEDQTPRSLTSKLQI